MSKIFIPERMSFDQLYRYSEPKRVVRSLSVKGPPLKIATNEDSVYWAFNFKAFPSTTGLRHHGYIKFLKPRSPRPLENVDCIVDCDCQDYRYRWAWSNKQRGASKVGPQSMNGAENRAPRVTNPNNIPGLCKHILALKVEIWGTGPDDGKLLSKLVKYANNKWANMPQEIEKARERDRRAAQARAARNRGERLPPVTRTDDEDMPDTAPTLPGPSNAQTTPKVGDTPSPKVGSDKEAEQAQKAGFDTAAEFNNKRRIGDSQPADQQNGSNLTENRVFRTEMNKDLQESIAICEEFGNDSFVSDPVEQTDAASSGPAIDVAPEDEPSEALGLLRQMVDLLKQLATDEEIPNPDEEESLIPDGEEENEIKPDTGADFNPQMKGGAPRPKTQGAAAGPSNKPQI